MVGVAAAWLQGKVPACLAAAAAKLEISVLLGWLSVRLAGEGAAPNLLAAASR